MIQLRNTLLVEKIFADMLVKQSKLDTYRILNANSIRGAELSKMITETVSLSYDLSDSVIVFETSDEPSQDIDVSEEYNGSIRQSVSMSLSLTIYGNESYMLARILKARFETEKVRYDLFNQGIHIVSVSEPRQENDFINNTLWRITGMKIHFAFEMTTSQIDSMETIEQENIISVESTDK